MESGPAIDYRDPKCRALMPSRPRKSPPGPCTRQRDAAAGTPAPVPAGPYRCVFLTEAKSSAAGQLSKKRRDLLKARRLDQLIDTCPRDDYIKPVSQPAMTTQLTSIHRVAGGGRITAAAAGPADDDDAEPADGAAMTTAQRDRWEPLTLAALLDYKTYVTAPGRGEFALGHVQLWPVR